MTILRTIRVALILAGLALLSPAWADGGPLSVSPIVQFTPSATIYASGQCIGPAGASAVQTIPLVQAEGSGGIEITDAQLVDSSGQGPNIDLYLFTAQPSGTYTDQVACSLALPDQATVIGPISFTSWVAFGTPKTARIQNFWQAANTAPSAGSVVTPRTVWFVLVSRGTPTFGASATLGVRIGGQVDVR